MSDTTQVPLDLETLSDEDFLKLDPKELQAVVQENTTDVPDQNGDTTTQPLDEADPNAQPEQVVQPEQQENAGKENPDPANPVPAKDPAQTQPLVPAEKPQENKAPKPSDPAAGKTTPDPKPTTTPAPVTPVVTAEQMADFYAKVSAPFKADGKDMQVRNPEDVIRLMQMGANYSRRMQELKPIRAQDNLLKAHGLNTPEKLNFLIDLSKGKPEAIQKLLKDHKVDPIDIDVSKEPQYAPTNYQMNPKDAAFHEAIENTIASEGGVDIIRDINAKWDEQSKEALREQPAIFENLLAQKRSGVYEKIQKELEYQRTMGFLTSVPFLQAYHQVGEAMQKAGVFNPPKVETPQVQSPTALAPIDTGTRKAVSQPKTETPNPNLSSTQQPRVTPSRDVDNSQVPDYSSMSDDDFLKLAPPR